MKIDVTNHSFVQCEKCGRIIAFEKDDVYIHEVNNYGVFSKQSKVIVETFIYCFCGEAIIMEKLKENE